VPHSKKRVSQGNPVVIDQSTQNGQHSASPKSNDMDKPKKLKSAFLLLGALLIAATALFVFGWLAEEMLEGDTEQFDSFVRTAVHQLATPGLTRLMQVFSFLGSVAAVTTMSLVAVCVSLYFRRIRTAALVAITMLGVAVLDLALKHAFHRPRPVAFFGATPSSYSFPSGHALGSFCFYGILVAILAARVRRRSAKFIVWMAAAVLVGMIGFSRIYLGVHYPSDVIAGYCAAAVWVGAVGFLDWTLRNSEGETLEGRQEHPSGRDP
jgi:undecaprenyl-diphosphatase